ncbi:MAG TPA: hypothetical protein VGI10_29700 [Polyangiaceae bacterium]
MSEKSIHYGVLLGSFVVGAFAFLHGTSRSSRSLGATATSLLALVPRDAAFELTCDFAQLRKSDLGSMATKQLSRLGGGSDLSQRCGFDPLALIERLAIAAPTGTEAAGESLNDFAIVASGHFKAEALVSCAERVIGDRGGEPARSSIGSLMSVRDRKGAGGELAARDDGPLIVSGGAYFRELVDLANTAASAGAIAARNPLHSGLRKALGDGTIVASWLVPKGWFERVADDERAKVSALAAVHSVGARLDVANDVRVTVLLDAADTQSAERVTTLLSQLRQSVSTLLPDPLLATLAKRIVLSQRAEQVFLRAELSLSEARTLLERVGEPP